MRLIVAVAALAMGACSTTPAMETALAPLDGQPVQLVFDQLGAPSSSTMAGADTIYEWREAKMVRGASARANPIAPSGDGAMPTGRFGEAAVPYTCDVWVLADAAGRIKESRFGEQAGGCRESAKKLRQLAYAAPR